MMEAERTSETSVDNYFTRQYIPEDNSEHHTHHRENLKSHTENNMFTAERMCYQTEKKEIPDDVSWIQSLPCPGNQSNVRRLSVQWDMFEKKKV
jgi:hypothetical protein